MESGGYNARSNWECCENPGYIRSNKHMSAPNGNLFGVTSSLTPVPMHTSGQNYESNNVFYKSWEEQHKSVNLDPHKPSFVEGPFPETPRAYPTAVGENQEELVSLPYNGGHIATSVINSPVMPPPQSYFTPTSYEFSASLLPTSLYQSDSMPTSYQPTISWDSHSHIESTSVSQPHSVHSLSSDPTLKSRSTFLSSSFVNSCEADLSNPITVPTKTVPSLCSSKQSTHPDDIESINYFGSSNKTEHLSISSARDSFNVSPRSLIPVSPHAAGTQHNNLNHPINDLLDSHKNVTAPPISKSSINSTHPSTYLPFGSGVLMPRSVTPSGHYNLESIARPLLRYPSPALFQPENPTHFIPTPHLPTTCSSNMPVFSTSSASTSQSVTPRLCNKVVQQDGSQFDCKNLNKPPYSNYPRSGNVDHSVFRTPGMAASVSDWNKLNATISLLNDRNLLPSDGPDLPLRPVISTPVNCDPDIMRCTLTNIPSTSKLLVRCRLPLGLVMHPFRDLSSLNTINSTVIVRCRSCRTYINPFVQFIDSGRRWRCNVCFLANAIPDDFYYDPGTQTYGDPARRPEIRSATVEFIAPSEYMLRPPQPATYLFCFDVSHNAISTGYLKFVCECLKTLLDRLPGDSRRQIGFLTFDSAIHFYKLYGETMKAMICPDLTDVFLPDCEGLINRIEDSLEVLREFLSKLPDTFASTNNTGNCLGSTLQAALKLIGATGGRITVFNTCLPNVGVGALHMREEPNDRNSVDVKHLGPCTDFYKTLALDCAAQQVAVDIFVFNSQYCDIATIAGASRFSGGNVYHYPGFYYPSGSTEASDSPTSKFESNSLHKSTNVTSSIPINKDDSWIEVERFRRDFDRYLTRKIGFEAVMRIRCTHGLSIQAFHGSFFVRSTDLMSLPNINPDAGFAVQLDLVENMDKCSTVCCQAAVLYTSSKGDRRIRVHTLCLPVVHTPVEVFQGADQGAIACLLGKMAVDRTISCGLSNAREALANAVADALSAFASNSSTSTNSNTCAYTLGCPPNLRLLPLYVSGLLRFRAFKVGSPVRLDDRSVALERLKCAPPCDMLTLLYPKLYIVNQFVSKPISSTNTLAQKVATMKLQNHGDIRLDADRASNFDEISSSSESDDISDADQLPGQLHLTAQSITRSGVYLLDTGEVLLLLVGSGEDVSASPCTGPEVLQQLLGISSPNELPLQGGPFTLPPIIQASVNKPQTIPPGRQRLAALISLLRRRRPIHNTLVCMRHDAPLGLRSLFLSALVEDRTESAPSYQEFLQMIQNLVTS